MMSCREAARLQSERLAYPLGRRRDWALRLHVLMCAGCRRYQAQLRWLHSRLRGDLRAEPSAALDAAARERIVSRLISASERGRDG